MERIFAATEDGYYFLPKEAGNPLLGKKIEAMIPAIKSDAAGSHHQEMTGDLPEHRVGALKYEDVFTPWPEVWDSLSGHAKATALRSNDAQTAGISLTFWQAWDYADTSFAQLPPDLQEKLTKMAPHKGVKAIPRKRGAADALIAIEARQPMQDDSGATTGLRRRPDYGESDSLTSTLNRENAKGASAQYVVALDAHNRKEASQKATMYVSNIDWAADCTKIAKFAYSPDPAKALKLGNLTAKAVMRQLNGPKFGAKSHIQPITV
jgi:hypothetical protein